MQKHLFLLMLFPYALSAMNAGEWNRHDHPREFIHQASRGNIDYLDKELKNGADINQANPETGWTALHTAIHNADMETILFLLDHGASMYRKTNKGLTARHFLKEHTATCVMHRGGFHFCSTNPCAPLLSKSFLEKINGTCMICREPIAELGTLYDCGHVIHTACTRDNTACPQCDTLTFNEIVKAQESDPSLSAANPIVQDIPWDEILEELPHDPSLLQNIPCRYRSTCTSAHPCSRCALLITTRNEKKIISDAASVRYISRCLSSQRKQQFHRIHATMKQHTQRLYQAWREYQQTDDAHLAKTNLCIKFKKDIATAPITNKSHSNSGKQKVPNEPEECTASGTSSAQCSERPRHGAKRLIK